jgi:hypothetical protein
MFEKRYGEFGLLNREVEEYYRALGILVQVRLASKVMNSVNLRVVRSILGEIRTLYHNLVQTLNAREEWMGLLTASDIS